MLQAITDYDAFRESSVPTMLDLSWKGTVVTVRSQGFMSKRYKHPKNRWVEIIGVGIQCDHMPAVPASLLLVLNEFYQNFHHWVF